MMASELIEQVQALVAEHGDHFISVCVEDRMLDQGVIGDLEKVSHFQGEGQMFTITCRHIGSFKD